MGRDDPKYIDGIWPLVALWSAGVLLMIPGLLASVVIVLWAGRRHGLRSGVGAFLAMVIAWVVAITMIRWDPARVGVWMLD
jgi:hypothetical protein